MRILVFGTGKQYQKRKEQLNNMVILAFLDNSQEKQGTYLDGIQVDKPENVGLYSYDYILLLSDYYLEMRAQLIQLGVPVEKIIDKENQGVFALWSVAQIKQYNVADMTKKEEKARILLYSHELSLTGAPRALYNMACVLKKAGYYVEVYSKREGKLLYDFLIQNIPVSILVSENEQYYLNVERVKTNFDLVVVNTICCYEIIKSLFCINIPVIWWLHEVNGVYDDLGMDKKTFSLSKNIHVYGMGQKAKETYELYFKGEKAEELLYGIEEFNKDISTEGLDEEKLVFATIGYVHPRKGQDFLLEAVASNWTHWESKAEFWIIGQIADEVREKYISCGKVRVFGQLEHSTLIELYKKIDVIICPSLQESMSIVVTEGMMQKKVCIVSDAAGIAKYITNYVNGLLCQAGDVTSLADSIQWVLDHPEKHREIGQGGYEVYQKYFEYSRFEKSVLKIVEPLVENKTDKICV